MKASILTIGDELLLGQVLDTNAHYLSNALKEIGIDVTLRMTLKDAYNELYSGVAWAAEQTDLILVTGGLGPTNDDITKKVLADFFHTELKESPEALKMISSFLSKKGVEMNGNNREQALLPVSAKLLPNTRGTASGMWFSDKGVNLISMPGVPFEMKSLMVLSVLPELKKRINTTVVTKFVLTQGLAESILAERLLEWEGGLPDNISLAYLPTPGFIKLRLTSKGNDAAKIESEIDRQMDKLRPLLGEYLIAEDESLLEEVLYKMLINSNKTISTAESCTGGTIASRLIAKPGSSAFFKGSIVAYSNDVKHSQLQVDLEKIAKFGAVSKEVVEQMAQGCLERLDTDYAIATSGIAGPDGGTDEKPVGTVWIAWASKNKVISNCFQFSDERKINIERSVNVAIGQLIKLVRQGVL